MYHKGLIFQSYYTVHLKKKESHNGYVLRVADEYSFTTDSMNLRRYKLFMEKLLLERWPRIVLNFIFICISIHLQRAKSVAALNTNTSFKEREQNITLFFVINNICDYSYLIQLLILIFWVDIAVLGIIVMNSQGLSPSFIARCNK